MGTGQSPIFFVPLVCSFVSPAICQVPGTGYPRMGWDASRSQGTPSSMLSVTIYTVEPCYYKLKQLVPEKVSMLSK